MSIRKRAKGQYQVRVRPFGAQTVPTKEAAEKLLANTVIENYEIVEVE